MADRFRRAKVPRHVRIYHRQLQSEAWQHLSGSGAKVLLALAALEKGDNNGDFFLSTRTGADRTGLGKNAVNRALHELQDKGFIYCAVPGGFSRKTPHAACWGLTWQAGPTGKNRAPSHAYEKWRPEKKHGPQNRVSSVPETGTVGQNKACYRPENGDSEAAEMAENRQSASVLKLGTQTSYQSSSTIQNPLVGWWQPDWRAIVALASYANALEAKLREAA